MSLANHLREAADTFRPLGTHLINDTKYLRGVEDTPSFLRVLKRISRFWNVQCRQCYFRNINNLADAL